MLVTVVNFKGAVNRVRVVSYRALESDWLKKDRWLNRIDTPVTGKTMKFCMPMPAPATFGATKADSRSARSSRGNAAASPGPGSTSTD